MKNIFPSPLILVCAVVEISLLGNLVSFLSSTTDSAASNHQTTPALLLTSLEKVEGELGKIRLHSPADSF